MTKHKNKPITSDLFGVTNCEDCNGTGQTVDKAPQGVTYELYEDCETCNGLGVKWQTAQIPIVQKMGKTLKDGN